MPLPTASSSSAQGVSSATGWSSSAAAVGWCATAGNCGTFTDTRETPARVYKWTKIGTQTWMAENLAWLPEVDDPDDFSETEDRYFVYGYTGTDTSVAKAQSNYATYGALYNYPAALKACPAGWHLPDTTEWSVLEKQLGGAEVAGVKLMATHGWASGGVTGTDAVGFSALPAGYCSLDFSMLAEHARWWTSTPYGGVVKRALVRYVFHTSEDVFGGNEVPDRGYSVRCLKGG